MKTCTVCGDEYEDDLVADDVCRWCFEKWQFADFARSCGLTRYPDPTGERYVYLVDGTCDGKKSENVDLIDELWNALVRARGGDEGLLLGRENPES